MLFKTLRLEQRRYRKGNEKWTYTGSDECKRYGRIVLTERRYIVLPRKLISLRRSSNFGLRNFSSSAKLCLTRISREFKYLGLLGGVKKKTMLAALKRLWNPVNVDKFTTSMIIHVRPNAHSQYLGELSEEKLITQEINSLAGKRAMQIQCVACFKTLPNNHREEVFRNIYMFSISFNAGFFQNMRRAEVD
uniref:Uncharacterized protein n=1 Tax=Glossina austeni TaxID=7395 RepID=A0A1A9UVQ1_GLOAU